VYVCPVLSVKLVLWPPGQAVGEVATPLAALVGVCGDFEDEMVDILLELMAELVGCTDELQEDVEELVGILEGMAEDVEGELAAEELNAMLEDDGKDIVVVVVVVVAKYGCAFDMVAEKDIPVLDKLVEDAAMLLLEEDIATLELDGAVELLLD